MVFFQATLLAGYVLAHLSLTRLGTRRQSRLQVAVMALARRPPVSVPMGWHPPTDRSPALWTLMSSPSWSARRS